MEIEEKTNKEIQETIVYFEKGLVYKPENNRAMLAFLMEMLPELEAGPANFDVFTEFRKYWQRHHGVDEVNIPFAETNPLILQVGVFALCKHTQEDRKRILETLTARQAEKFNKQMQLRDRAVAVAAIIKGLPLLMKFFLVVLDELALLSSVHIDVFDRIQADLRKQKLFIINAAKNDPGFDHELPCSWEELYTQHREMKVQTTELLHCYDLARSINEGS